MSYFSGKKSEFVIDYVNKIVNDDSNQYHTKSEVARALGIKPQYLNSIMTGLRNVSDKFFDKFVTVFELNPNDLNVTDFGLISDQLEDNDTQGRIDYIVDALFNMIRDKDKEIKDLSIQIGELKQENRQLRNDKGYNLAAEP